MGSTKDDDTPPAGARAEFKTTRWSKVHILRDDESPEAREALSDLCRDYWYPLYAFARRRGHSREDAQDLTQGFFTRLFEKDYLMRADPARGRFRTFLLSSFNHFLINDWQKHHAAIHGGTCTIISWDELTADERYSQEPAHDLSPEKLYDQRWALTLIEKAMAALRREFVAAREEAILDGLQGFLSGDKSPESYRAAGARLGLTEDSVKMRVYRLKRRFGMLLRDLIADTVSSESEIDEEMRQLFAVWS